MAIIPALEDIEVTICVDSTPLLEFDNVELVEPVKPVIPLTKPKAKHIITKYIQTNAENTFSFHASIKDTFTSDCPTLEFQFYVDGVEVESELVLFKDGKLVMGEGGWKAEIKGVEVRRGEVKTFCFERIKTSSNDASTESIEANKQRLLKVGMVAVEVYRKSEARPPPMGGNNLWYSQAVSFAAPMDVHEKSVKGEAKSHGTKFGDVVPSLDVWQMWPCEYLDGRGSPLARFEFKYRSEEALKQLHIVERTPEPEPEPEPESEVPNLKVPDEPVDMAQLDEEERLKAEEFVRNLRGEKTTTIKREREESPLSVRNLRRRSKGKSVVIDLTSDSDSEDTI